MDDFDSILKNKKNKDNFSNIVESPKKKRNYLLIDIVAVVIILIISYIYYYKKILTPKNIFLNDVNQLKEVVSSLIKPLNLNFEAKQYSMEGTISFDEFYYDYSVIRDKMKHKITLTNSEHKLIYYTDNSTTYTMFDDFMESQYIEKINDGQINLLRNFFVNLDKKVNDSKFSKNLYLDGNMPVVEVNVTFNKDDLNNFFGFSRITDDIEVLLTIKNDAIMNVLVNGKMIINNKTKNTREVYNYQNGTITKVDNDNNAMSYIIKRNADDFEIKINKKDVLYSVLKGTKKENSYQYSYQIIDMYYNLLLDVDSKENNTVYKFVSHTKNDAFVLEKNLVITNSFKKDGALEEDVSSKLSYDSLTMLERDGYQLHYDNIMAPIHKFLEEYSVENEIIKE